MRDVSGSVAGEFSLHPGSFPHGKLEPQSLETLQTHGHN